MNASMKETKNVLSRDNFLNGQLPKIPSRPKTTPFISKPMMKPLGIQLNLENQNVQESSEDLHELVQYLLDAETDDSIQYKLLKIIGSGKFGLVRKAKHRLTGEIVAIKIYNKAKLKAENQLKGILKEIEVLERIQHHNVVRFYESIDTEEYILLVMENCSGQSLQYLISDKRCLNEIEAKNLFVQIVEAVNYLHRRNVVHRDIKPENIVLMKDIDINVVKLLDYGFSIIKNPNEKNLGNFCGTPSFMAPEMITKVKYAGGPIDIWSLGVLLYFMIVGRLPFEAKKSNDLYNLIRKGQYALPSGLSEELKDLIQGMLEINPDKRWRADEVRRHPWFNNIPIQEGNNLYNDKAYGSLFIADEKIDQDIVDELSIYGLEKNQIHDQLSYNVFNGTTTWYRLLHLQKLKLKKIKTQTLQAAPSFPQMPQSMNNESLNNDLKSSSSTSKIVGSEQFTQFLKDRIAKVKLNNPY